MQAVAPSLKWILPAHLTNLFFLTTNFLKHTDEMERTEIIFELRKFIHHSDNIMRHSIHYADLRHTRAMAAAKSMLVSLTKPADYSQVARFILLNQTTLYGILPDHRNRSYSSSFERLERIITACKQI